MILDSEQQKRQLQNIVGSIQVQGSIGEAEAFIVEIKKLLKDILEATIKEKT